MPHSSFRRTLLGTTALVLVSTFSPVAMADEIINGGAVVTVPGNHASPWTISDLLLVGSDTPGTLIVGANGRLVTEQETRIGSVPPSGSKVRVSGENARWTAKSIIVGYVGTDGTMEIGPGGTVEAGSVKISFLGGQGAVTVGGAGASLTIDSQTIGSAEPLVVGGRMTVEDGGKVSVSGGPVMVGLILSGLGTLHVRGEDSLFETSADLHIGIIGDGALIVEDGGTVTSKTGVVGGSRAGQAIVSGRGSSWRIEEDLAVGLHVGGGSLTVANGGTVASGDASVGFGLVRVTGEDSTLSSGALEVGWFPTLTGRVIVEDGGTVTSASASLGTYGDDQGNSSVGFVEVIGAGSSWQNAGDLKIGDSGTGTLAIADGGTVTSGDAKIGVGEFAVGSVTVSGEDADGNVSAWESTGDIYVGNEGIGTLNITGGGNVSNYFGYIGAETGSTGTVTVWGSDADGHASSWNNIAYLRVGGKGNGTLIVEDGGRVSNSYGYIGEAADAVGEATVTGAGSRWNNGEALFVGRQGAGTLTVANGGAVTAKSGNIGFAGTGIVTVTGMGSTWENSQHLSVGGAGKGTLIVEAGGKVTSETGSIGQIYQAGTASGAATVTGAGSLWDIASALYVAESGAGTLTLAEGGMVSVAGGTGTVVLATLGSGTGTLNIGAAAGDAAVGAGTLDAGSVAFGDGAATLVFNHNGTTNFASALASTGSGTHAIRHLSGMTILTGDGSGFAGPAHIDGGTLEIAQGGKLGSSAGFVGHVAGLTGTVSVSGPAARWDNSGDLHIGYGGSGTLNVTGGGSLTSANAYAGGFSGSVGAVTVSGAGSSWVNAGALTIGYGAASTMTIADGGTVASATGVVGGGSVNAVSTVTVTGAGSSWANAGALTVGDNGRGQLVIADGGKVSLSGGSGALLLGNLTDGYGVLAIGAAAGQAASAAGTLEASAVHFGNGWGDLVFNHTGATTFAAGLDSGGGNGISLSHLSGTTTLTGDGSRFGGQIGVSGGTLIVDNVLSGHGAIPATVEGSGRLVVDGELRNNVRVRNAGILAGAGIIAGNVTLASGGVLSGASGQTLGIGGDVAMDASSVVDVALGLPSATALFDVDGNLTLDGTLNVSDQGGFGAGIYRIFDYDGVLDDQGLIVGATPAGVDADSLYVQTSETGKVNLVSTAGAVLGFWDGGDAGLRDNGAVDGGAGAWRADGRNWTLADGALNGPFQPIPTFAVFQAAGGTVTVDDAAGAIAVAGMQFAVDGYRVEGDAIMLQGAGGATTVRVGDGTVAGASMSAIIAAELTGASALVKSDLGTLILSGTNSYGGGTQVAAGTLIADAGSIRGDIANAATVVFDQASDAGFDGAIAGLGGVDGDMIKRGAGELTLAGTSSLDWSIEAGGLTADAGRFGGDATILSGANLTFEQSASATYAGVLSGIGDFALSGAGTVTLTGNSSAFMGTTSVAGGGMLVVGTAAGGALGGSLTVAAGGLLGGTGTIGTAGSTVTIAAGAVHAPGNSIGVQTFAGDYANHGTLRIEATSAAADRIVVAGSVDITGAVLDLVLSPADPSGWDVFSGPFTIIDKQSAGAVVGTFVDPMTKNLLFLDTTLDYAGGDGNDVTLQLVRNDLTFAGVGNTRNQIATGTAVDTLGNTDPLWRSIALTNDPDVVRASFDALSGEIHASATTALVEDSRFLRNAVNDRIRAAFDGVGAPGGTVMTYGDGGPQASAAGADRFAVWGHGFGSWGRADSDGNAARLTRSTGGFFLGADALAFDTWRLGAVAGYSRTSFEADDRASSGASDNYHLGLYGGADWGALALRAGAAYTWHDIDTGRSVSIPGVADSLKDGYRAGTAQVFGELGYGIEAGGVGLEPFANLAHVRLRTDGFAEKGGVAALNGRAGTADTTFATLGVRAATTFDLNGASLTARGMLGWRHAFGDTAPDATMRFASGGDAFAIAGVPIARDAVVVEAGFDLRLSPDATLGVSYGAQFGSGTADQSFRAGFNLKF